MSVKSIKAFIPSSTKYVQGEFDKYNPKKYFGPRPIIYRSSYELAFMRKVEANNAVLQWSSENIVIPYTMKEKKSGKVVVVRHNYHIDFTVILKNGSRYIVEVKPKAFTPLNESQILRNPEVYKNACKWKAAMVWCKANGYEFKVVTEDHLRTKIF